MHTQQTAYLLMRTHRWCERPIQQVAYTESANISYLAFFLLFLSAEVVLIISSLSLFLTKYLSGNSTNTLPPENLYKELSDSIIRAIFLNVVEIVSCCFFLRIVAKFSSFVGYSRVFKYLCRLPNFWTLILSFLL